MSTNIVRPWGVLGAQYEVDDDGLRRFKLASRLAIVGAVLPAFRHIIGMPWWLTLTIAAAVLATIIALCINVARNGRKL